jgi:hypothetical protein
MNHMEGRVQGLSAESGEKKGEEARAQNLGIMEGNLGKKTDFHHCEWLWLPRLRRVDLPNTPCK